MRRLRSMSRPGWIAIGVVLGAIAIPGIAVAATATLVSIRGNNHTAFVSPANQLLSAESDPASTFAIDAGIQASGTAKCQDLGAVSATRGAVLKAVNLDVFSAPAGPVRGITFYASSTCSGTPLTAADFTQNDTRTIALGSGVALPAGRHVSAAVGGIDLQVQLYGYTVPGAAVPAGAPNVRHVGATRPRR